MFSTLGVAVTVLYRALWTADLPDGDAGSYLDKARACFSRWAVDDEDTAPLGDGSCEVRLFGDRDRTVTVRSVGGQETTEEETGPVGFEGVARDDDPARSAAWTTKVRVICDGESAHVLVENHIESDDLTLRVAVGRPLVVNDLLGLSAKPLLGNSALLIEPLAISADGIPVLVQILQDPGRRLPVIVCSEPGGQHDDEWLRWAARIARRTTGIASVVTLDNAAVTAFKNALDHLAIWGGGIRVYAPQPVVDPADGWRHRFTRGIHLQGAPDSMLNRIVYSVAQLSTRRRIPEVFAAFADAPANEQEQHPAGYVTAEEFEASRQEWEDQRELDIAEWSEVEQEFAKANGHLSRLREALIGLGQADVFWGAAYESPDSVPDQVQDTSEAVLAAQMYLGDWVEVPDTAACELADIDTAPSAFAWGSTAWRGFRALAAYAQDRAEGYDRGGFRDWCLEGRPQSWPTTPKKLSMTESQTVQNHPKYRSTRLFKVSTDVDPDGETWMWSHLKIAEGGGDLAPRIYFHDDTGGKTGKVHVGFVGPHYLVPNTKS
jgi:hypothetical protein